MRILWGNVLPGKDRCLQDHREPTERKKETGGKPGHVVSWKIKEEISRSAECY